MRVRFWFNYPNPARCNLYSIGLFYFMDVIIKNAVECYQCSGCINGSDTSCYAPHSVGIGCEKHLSGTLITSIGKIFLGLPNGFNRLGFDTSLRPNIFQSFEQNEVWKYDKFNIPVWKHLNEDGHTLVRGIMPRVNLTFLHIYLEDCLDKINCLEITKEDIEYMD